MKRCLLLLLLPFVALADERILDFHSEIRVMTNGMIEVTETIRVRAEGNRVRRGPCPGGGAGPCRHLFLAGDQPCIRRRSKKR